MADFDIHDRRHGSTGGKADLNPQARFEAALKASGIKTQRLREETTRPSSLPFGDPRTDTAQSHFASRQIQGTNRMDRTASGSSSVQRASERPRDPMWYWRQNNIPYDFTDPDELKRIREFCNTPDAPITMADGSSKPIGDVVAGDEVMGWTYDLGWNGYQARRFTSSTVLASNRRMAPAVVRLHMASGRTIDCTPDHKWFNPHYLKVSSQTSPRKDEPFATDWAKNSKTLMDEYRPAFRGSELLFTENIRFVQTPNSYRGSPGKISVSDAQIDNVVSIEQLGEREVVSMQTTTGNYIAWGYLSKNCRLLYATHPIVSACIDVYSKLPMQGMAFSCKDPKIVEFYEELFMDQLNYEEHLLKMGRQYWLSGESWSLGGWNETLGIWQEDELLHPDDVEVERDLFLKEPRYSMKLPQPVRDLINSRQPRWRYEKLIRDFPELVNYAASEDLMPVSNIVLQQMRFDADDFSERGIPILLRAMRTLTQEEMLNSALDSIADRLYTPLILTKLGAKAQDLGGSQPWVPSQDDLDNFNAQFDIAMAADFRAMTYHWAVDMQPVFGRENVPDLSNDFDRIVERILMVFGLSQTMLTGASAGETYAADALNRDVVTQLLSHYQRMQARFVKSRAAIVAEAQGHYDYEVRGGMRYVQTEDIWVVDEEGQGHIEEIPKLLVPDLTFKVLNLSDEEQERQFVETLAESGVPVPYRTRMHSAGIDFEEAVEESQAEKVKLAVAEQETRKEIYRNLKRRGLPISQDLRADFDPVAKPDPATAQIDPATGQPIQPQMPGGDAAVPSFDGQQELPVIAPTPDDQAQAEQDEEMQGEDPNENQDVDGGGNPMNRPQESDEEREDMPKAASLSKEAMLHNAAFDSFGASSIREATAKHYVEVDNSGEVDEGGNALYANYRPHGIYGDPKTAGMTRHVKVPDKLLSPEKLAERKARAEREAELHQYLYGGDSAT